MKNITEKYEIIYIDPPWAFNDRNTGGSMKSGASAKYSVMNLDQIRGLPVPDIADENCVMFMWWVGSQPKEALDLIKSWGFKLKTMSGFVWVKKTKLWKMFFGMGHWTRAGAECCLIATKGKPKRLSASVRSVVEAVNESHSKKPNIFADKIVELCGDLPRIELFARDKKEGWDSWGNEV